MPDDSTGRCRCCHRYCYLERNCLYFQTPNPRLGMNLPELKPCIQGIMKGTPYRGGNGKKFLEKLCEVCNNPFRVWPSRGFIKCCLNLACQGGLLSKAKIKNNPGRFKEGKMNPAWKNNVRYAGLHAWVINKIGIPDHCDLCGLIEQPKDAKRNYFELSCRTGNYTREFNNWWMLCKKCHYNYDRKVFGIKRGGSRKQI